MTVSCAYRQRVTHILVTLAKVFHHLTSVSFPLPVWSYSQVFQFTNSFPFIRYDGYGNRMN